MSQKNDLSISAAMNPPRGLIPLSVSVLHVRDQHQHGRCADSSQPAASSPVTLPALAAGKTIRNHSQSLAKVPVWSGPRLRNPLQLCIILTWRSVLLRYPAGSCLHGGWRTPCYTDDKLLVSEGAQYDE